MRPAFGFLLYLLMFTLLLPPFDQPARRAAGQQKTVILWTGEAHLTHKHSGTQAEVTVTWSRTADLNFSVDSRRKIDPKTRKLSHTLSAQWSTKAGVAASIRHGKNPLDEQQIDLAEVQMSVKTCAPELSAPVAGLADNTLLLSVAATPGVEYRLGARESPGELALTMRGEFPYDHDETEFDPPEVDVPQMQTSGSNPLPGLGAILNPPNTPAKMKVTMKRKPLKLEYEPLKNDLIRSVPRGKGYSPVASSSYYAKGKGGWFIHGNSRIQVMVDGKDATTSFSITRFIADSIQSIDRMGRRVGQIRSGAWHLDTEAVGGLWVDIPGQHLVDPPQKWRPPQRYMQEYLVGARGFPEFGGLYFIVVIDTKPNAYRVRMYPAQTVSIAQWCAIKARTTPYQNEDSSGDPVDTGWQTVR